MCEIIFLFALALIWIVFACVQDLKNREVANWLNFSLIIFALGFRFFYCLFNINDFIMPFFNFKTIFYIFNPLTHILFIKEILQFIHFFLSNLPLFQQGLYGLLIFFILGNLLYYGRMFAGGDAKLMIALGAILPFSNDFFVNLKILVWFFLIFLIAGAVYGAIWSLILSIKNFKKLKKEFSKKMKKNKKLVYASIFAGVILIALGFAESILFFVGFLIFIFPYFYIYAKSVDEVCMIKKIKTNQLTEGDWLYKNAKIGKKTINAKWEGLDKKEIKLIRKKYQEIKIRQGIPFVPVFLISFLILIWLWANGLIENFLFY